MNCFLICFPLIAPNCLEMQSGNVPDSKKINCLPVVMVGSYLGALLGNHGHGRASDVAGAHAADLDIPFVAHGCISIGWRRWSTCSTKDGGKRKVMPSPGAKIQQKPATCHEYEYWFDNNLLCNLRINSRKRHRAMCQIGTKSIEMECSGLRRSERHVSVAVKFFKSSAPSNNNSIWSLLLKWS